MRWILAIFFCLLAACHHQPQAYMLKQEGRTQVLMPPASKPEIKSARQHPAQQKGCDIEAESFTVTWHGNTARVAVKTETYFTPAPPPGQASPDAKITVSESGPRMYSETLAGLEHFREALAAREDSGCFRDDENVHLRQAITEKFPFPPQIASFLRFGTYTRTGFIDLTAGFVLRLVTPQAGDPDVSFYEVAPMPADNRVRLVLASGAGKALALPEKPAFLRYLYWTGGSVNFRTTILGVPERSMLNDATDRFLASPEDYCSKPGEGIFCQSIAKSVGLNPGFYVHVNGKNTFVRLGAQLGEALGEERNGMRLGKDVLPCPKISKCAACFTAN
jgi:hypothetical protein